MATDTAAQQPARAVVVAVNATGRCDETIETAAMLAAAEGADLEVVFVEDANLLRLADLPVTREIDRLSGAIRDIDGRRVLRALEAEARRLRQEIARIGVARAVRSRLRIARGQIFAEALSASTRADVTFVHAAVHAFPGERLALGRVRAARAVRGKSVWSLFEGGLESVRALETAQRLAVALECGLVVLIAYRDDDDADKYAHEVSSRVARAELRLLKVAGGRSPLEARVLEPQRNRLLVMAKQSPSLDEAATHRHLDSLPVPLVLVS